jgi:hypothetical protein
MRYEAWLLATATDERRSMGVIQASSGSATTGLSVEGSNLLASFDAFGITREADTDPSPSPSGDAMLRWALPPQALIHIRNLLVSCERTSGQASLTSGLRQAAGAAQHEAEQMRAAQRTGDLDGTKRHAEALVNLVDGAVRRPRRQRGDHWGGRRVGLDSGYIRAVQQEARRAAAAPDATPNIKFHTRHIMTAGDNLTRAGPPSCET